MCPPLRTGTGYPKDGVSVLSLGKLTGGVEPSAPRTPSMYTPRTSRSAMRCSSGGVCPRSRRSIGCVPLRGALSHTGIDRGKSSSGVASMDLNAEQPVAVTTSAHVHASPVLRATLLRRSATVIGRRPCCDAGAGLKVQLGIHTWCIRLDSRDDPRFERNEGVSLPFEFQGFPAAHRAHPAA